jgi:4,5-DOPA dioxygenase extradiol
MPALFIGHGSPMNAIEENEFSRGLRNLAKQLPKPKAVLCISAHWETEGIAVTAAARPATIHDFHGFPKELFDIRYPAPGNPALARRVAELLGAQLDPERGLDHGSWGVLRIMYPDADVPVLQLSLDATATGPEHYHRAKQLAPLRGQRVLIVGSGNIVHNLRNMDYRQHGGFDWAVRFNEAVKGAIAAGDYERLATFETLTPEARQAVPSREHFLPLLYVLAVKDDSDTVTLFNDKIVMGSIAMTSILLASNALPYKNNALSKHSTW